jgi:hypothetical protein
MYLQYLLLTHILPKPLISKNKGGKTMKLKLTVLLATFVVTMGLLLGTSAAQEFTVEVDSTGTNATHILNLPVTVIIDEEQVIKHYDVTFRYEEARDVYPNGVEDFDFLGETNVVALRAVRDALNSEPEVTTVGPANDTFIFLPITIVPGFRKFVNLTSEYLGFWDGAGIKIVNEKEKATYADFTEATTACTADVDCDDGEYCNGQEACVDGQCEAGPAPCVEGEESCSEDNDSCEPVQQPCAGDLNNNGVVDDEDFLIFVNDWGRTDCPIQ